MPPSSPTSSPVSPAFTKLANHQRHSSVTSIKHAGVITDVIASVTSLTHAGVITDVIASVTSIH